MSDLNCTGLTGEIVTPDDPGYDIDRQEWNRAVQKYPRAIVYCFDQQDVRNAVCWAREHKAGIRIRSGGHSYEGYSTDNDVLVIDISEMNGLRLDKAKNILNVEAGVNNRELYEFIGSRGYPFPVGTCPAVGVSGYTLGGGWGYSSRMLGLGCDSLVELELIDYEGRLLIANKHRNSDLFWACRGAGGGNFGVVVSMAFKLPPKVDKVSLIEIYYPRTIPEVQAEFLDTWQRWLPDADKRIGLSASFYNAKAEGVATYVRGIFYGAPEEAKELLRPFTDISGAQLTVQYQSFLEAIRQIEDTYPDSEKFKSTGRFAYRLYGKEELEKLVGFIQERPRGSIFTALTVYAMGGAIEDIRSGDTAFYYRNARYIMGIQSIWENPTYARDNIDWVQKKFGYIQSITRGSYVNFPYSGLKDYEKDYFGQYKYRLEEIKRKYDPFDVFTFSQGIKAGE